MPHEGVSSDSGRWINLERAGLKEREKKRERKGDGAQARAGEEYCGHYGRPRSSLESSGWGATVHGFGFRKH